MDSTYSLADALAGLEQEEFARNPFAITGNALTNALAKQINPATYTGNPWAAIGAQFGSSLLGSALTEVGRQQVRGQLANYAKDLNRIRALPFESQLGELDENQDYQQLVPYFTEEEMRRQKVQQERAAQVEALQQKALVDAAMTPPKRSTIMQGDQRLTQEFVPGQGWQTIAEAPRTAKAPGEEGELPLKGLNAERAQVINGLPKQYRSQAIKEFGFADDLSKGRAVIGQAFDAVKQTGALAAQVPFSNAAALVDAAKSAIMTALQSNWKGPMSDTDLARIDGLMPRAYDTPARTEIRKRQMMEVLLNNSKSTPLLSAIGGNAVAEKAAPPAAGGRKPIAQRAREIEAALAGGR